jgi:hypothetical protein
VRDAAIQSALTAAKGLAMHGKWEKKGVPHKGWECINYNDLGSPSAVCEMCETQEIRYVHYMQHDNYPEILGVGCVCAEHMEQDYEAPRKRELVLRAVAGRRGRWLTRKWQTSSRGNSYLNVDGFHITIFRKSDGTWGGVLKEIVTGREVISHRTYYSEDHAKLGAFDGMIFLKNEKGWGN